MRHHGLQLPDRDADLYGWARGCAPLFDRGPRAAFLHATSRQRFAGAGELEGQAPKGRTRDYLYSRSLIRGQDWFRYREISPDRQVLVLLDLRDIARNEESRRLLSCGVAAAVLVAALPETRLTWAAFGADRAVPPVAIEAERPAHLLRGAARAMLRFGRDPQADNLRKQEGAIRRILAAAPDAHLVIVSHHLERDLFRRLPFLFGATVFLVEAAADGFRNPRGALSLGGLFAPGLTGELNPKFLAACVALQSKRSKCLPIPADGELLGVMAAALGRRRQSRPTWR